MQYIRSKQKSTENFLVFYSLVDFCLFPIWHRRVSPQRQHLASRGIPFPLFLSKIKYFLTEFILLLFIEFLLLWVRIRNYSSDAWTKVNFLFPLHRCRGMSDPIFGLAVVYASLIMYDAQVSAYILFLSNSFLCFAILLVLQCYENLI